ncbi:hypothetical protein [Moritella sp. 28]|uniref:hypothetical protein n=1 Tax=Moritella sp. 28 TaxID=2746232 RepID=UPI001BAB8D7C|nr:hypothetical protein [Moritella sp. 28]QUM84596.1 hypothetical protein HWV02_08810 [Moritella sp. 28]
MARSIWFIAIALYIGTMITYHRFENSKHVLDILGNIPTFFASLAAIIAGFIALKTYTDSKRKEPSKAASDAFQECLKSLIEVLTSDKDKMYKLYYVGVCHETLSKVELLITEPEHKSVIAVTHNILKHHIEILLNTHGIEDYFCFHKPYEKSYRLNICDSANALYEYWREHIRGNSNICKISTGKVDFFASSPFGIDEKLLIKALALYANDHLDLVKITARIKSKIQLIETETKHELIDFAERFPVAIAYLLLRQHTKPYRTENGLELGLLRTYSDEHWTCYNIESDICQVEEIPNLKVLT